MPGLPGGPAFIAWDEERRILFAARDPMGSVGLYYRETQVGLQLAARATDLVSEQPSSSDLDREGLVSHLCWGVPEEGSTYFRGIRQVPPGSILIATRSGVRVEDYWKPDLSPYREGTDRDWESRLRETLDTVMRALLNRLGGPRQLGLTLSAGLDSGAIAVALADALDEPRRITALRWTAPDLPESDESQLSAEVAQRYGLSDLPIRADQHWTFCPPLGSATEPDSPLAVPYVGLWDATFRAARGASLRHLLTGIGGDHLLAGNIYGDFDLIISGRWLRAARSLAGYRRHRRLGAPAFARHLAQLAYWSGRLVLGRPTERAPAWLHRSAVAEAPRRSGFALGLPSRLRHLELLRDPLRAETLRILGLQASRFDLRLHHPWLDHQMFQLSSSIPTQQLFRDGFTKHVVRRAFRGTLPRAILDSPNKILPTGIFHRGLREREVDRVRGLLTEMRAADLQLVEPTVARREYESYLRGERHDLSALWPTLTLEAWLRQHFA